ncbi:MAG: T9SS type A sorting domain-containing protein, partial [Chitinophagaceae bacterium]
SNINGGGGTFPVHPVSWTMLPNYQTLQYYFVGMDPGASRNVFVGGAQDNGTYLRDALSLFNTPPAEINNHVQILGGDGTNVSMSLLNISDQNQYVYAASQFGNIRRVRITNTFATTSIRPNGLTASPGGGSSDFGEFVTNFRLDPDNTEDLYYVNFNRLFRTTAASSVTAGGWTELTGVSQAVNPGNPTAGTNIAIRAMAFSRGAYATSHALYIGTTNGKIFRLDDPRNMNPTNIPVNITPVGLTGNVQDISVNPNNDDEIMAVVSNYGVVSIWHTTNAKLGAPAWRSIEGNLDLPSIRSCMIVVKKDAANQPVTEYYVGTSIGLYSTTNISGIPTWQREGASVLNFAVARSLAYRPVDNVMVIGTHGNGMYYANLGTPNFTPNLNTAIEPITNDKSFIKSVFPTLTSNTIQFTTGNLFTIKKIDIRLTTINGQEIYRSETGYQNGSVNTQKFAAGAYILSITSDDGKYRHIQKIIKR